MIRKQRSLSFKQRWSISMALHKAEKSKATKNNVNESLDRLLNIAENFDQHGRTEAKVLVLYTGGTIGMIKNKEGAYAPMPNVLQKRIKTYPQLHDLEYMETEMQGVEHADDIIIFPEIPGGKRIAYFVYEYAPLLDSSNMAFNDYINLAKDIRASYTLFDGFVILHGTDTLAYTASALSFICENLGKSIVITGAQIPLFEARSDGRENFLNSVYLAGSYCIPEVTVFFNNKLLRGNRTNKSSNSSLDAFTSPNMTSLVEIGTSVKVDWKSIFRSPIIEAFKIHDCMNMNVGLLRIFPSITVQTVRSFLRPPIQGVVLQTYGAGNCPSNRTDIVAELKNASNQGILILNITQCQNGSVDAAYETGKVLLDAGVIPGSDMTTEAALAKLGYVLSKNEWSIEEKRKKMEENLRGELTILRTIRIDDIELIKAVGRYMNLSTSEEMDALKDILYPSVLDSIAMIGNVEKMELLRKTGANMSAQDYDKRTPLHIAVCEGHTKLIEYLLKHGASVHQRDRSNKTPLMNAIEFNQHEAIKLLKKAGADFLMSQTTLGELLCSAAQQGNVEMLESFKLADADLNQTDCNNTSALHKAVEYDQEKCVEYLLKNKVDKNARDIFKRTPKDIAEVLGLKKIANMIESIN